jgi:transcription antitermination factor NusA-like protein
MLKVGYLVPFMVIKGLPDYDSYLTTLINKGILAQLPRKYTSKQYKIGETGWASIFAIRGSRIILSQKSPQYVRKILEYLLSPLIQEDKIKFKKVAKVFGSHFYKIAVESSNGASGKEIVKMCLPYLEGKIKDYIDEKIILVKYSKDIERYVINSLAPAPLEHIQKVIHIEDMNEITVYVDDKYAGLFLGAGGKNAATASKLTGIKVIIFPC